MENPHLVGGLEHEFYFPYIGNNIGNKKPNWLIFFRGVGIPPTRFLSGGTVTFYFQTIHDISIIPTKCGPGASVIARQVLAGSAAVFWSDHSWSDGTSIDPQKWGKSTKLLVFYLVMIFWLVVCNMNFVFHNIWDNPSHWLIFFFFQDG